MRNKNTNKIICLTAFLFFAEMVSAQSAESGDSNYLIYSLMAVAVLIFFFLLVQVSDNLLAIEAKQSGADKDGANFGIFPSLSEIFAPKLPGYTANKKVHALSKGHDILLEGGVASNDVHEANVKTFAVQPKNFTGLSPIPKVTVEVGATVKAGDHLFFDKKDPEVMHVAPVSGEVIAINRAEKRSIAEVVILADNEQSYRSLDVVDLDKATREELVSFLLDSGAWPLIRQRPFNIVPSQTEVPRDIFISTFDTAPLAPNSNVVVAGKEDAFQKGLDVLNKLTDGTVYLGVSANGEEAPSDAYANAQGVDIHYFNGKHPAGNVGVQIHHIKPINSGDKVWTLGVQEVITIGRLFTEGRFNAERVVAITGAELSEPKYVSTKLGANLGDLLAGNMTGDNNRIVSGDVLTGQKKETAQYLNIFDDQVTVLQEGDYYEMFGWLIPVDPRPSISNTFPNFLFPDLKFRANTNTHGERRAFVVTGQYESVLPMDIYPQHLMKAILVKDFERMEGLGILELAEEDVALCEFVCTSKQPLQQILKEGLDIVREQS
jgi:Na+-transporting NADH:ubiquinone oxidoreductase subunit A